MNTKNNSKKETQAMDIILHGLIHNNTLRCAIAITTETTRVAQQKHELGPMATIALGRTIACTALMGSTLKEDQQYISCHIEGDGPLKSVSAEFIAPASIRGYTTVADLASVIKPGDPVPFSVGEAVGSKGTVTIRRGSKTGQDPYTGISSLVNGEIAEDIAQYYVDSEQLPSIIAAGVKLDTDGKILGAGGILIQKIGGEELDESTLEFFEEKANQLNLSEELARGATVEQIFKELTGLDADKQMLSRKPIGFHCFCSRDAMAKTLISLGEKELRELQEEVGKIEVRCHYCNTVNNFSLEELTQH
jgi:molecular chaperone Hsp33